MDINELLTRDGEDCLELALTNDTDTEIVSLILDARMMTDHLYENSNTALHLAVINHINIESIRLLLRRIDLNSLLLTNDDGYTVLHLAVRNNQFLVVEAILDSIDERELGKRCTGEPWRQRIRMSGTRRASPSTTIVPANGWS